MRKGLWVFIFCAGLLAFPMEHAFGVNLELSLKHAVELGILNNRDVVIEKYLHKIALEKVLEARGIFDPVLSSNLEGGRWEVPIAEIFYKNGSYVEEAVRGGLNLKGKVFTGASYGVDFSMEQYETTSQVVTLSPRYSTRLEFSLTQPLLKEFGEDITKTKIRIAEKGTQVSKFQVKDRVIRTVSSVEEAYWNLVYAGKVLDFHKEAARLAKDLLDLTEVKVKAGEMAPINLVQAKSGLASMEENVVSAENELKKAEHDLKLLLGMPENEGTLFPLDQPRDIRFIPSLAGILDSAQKNRPDLQASKSRLEQKKIEEKYMNDQVLPRLDLIGKYGRRGLSGVPSSVMVTGAGGKPEPVGDRVQGTVFSGETTGWDSMQELYTGRGFDYWSLGLKLEIPLGNREAEGRYRQTKLERMKMETEIKSLDEKIANEVKKGILDIQTTIKMREASGVTVEYAEQNLQVEEQRFKAGESTSYDVLKLQKDVTEAKTRHIKALIEYTKAWARVRAAEGVSLKEYEIEFNEKMM